MKVSWRWLNELIDITDISLDIIIKKLILAGFEIESIQNKPEIQDRVIDISITTNRGDTSSLIGLAREINILFNLKNLYSTSNYYINYKNRSEEITIENDYISKMNTNAILNCQLNTIINLNKCLSPIWLINYLKAYDIKSQNIIQDIQEYIKIKWDQDIEIFDLDKINSINSNAPLINIELLKHKDMWMNTINTNYIMNDKSIELLKYKNKTLSIIGIQSNPEFKCSNNTSSVIVIGTACKKRYMEEIIKNIDHKTEKTQRHLKYTSVNDLVQAYNETIQLILHLTKGKTKKLCTINNYQFNKIEKTIYVKIKHIVNILGPIQNSYEKIYQNKIFEVLKQLNFKPKPLNDYFQVTIPQYRHDDIQVSTDVIEEIGRVYGFDKFVDILPVYDNKGKISKSIKYIYKIRYILSGLGLHELINYSLSSQEKTNHSKIQLYNSLLDDQSQLKDNLIQDLILAKKYNIQKKNLYIEFFEIGKVFNKEMLDQSKKSYKYIETLNLAGILGNDNFYKESWQEKSKNMGWFQAKGLLEDFLEQINTKVNWVKPNSNLMINNYWHSICHPYRLSILCNQDTQEPLGIFGELSTKCNKNINSKHRTYIFELNLYKLIKAKKNTKYLSYRYKPYSNYPIVTRDISIRVNKNNTARAIQANILNLQNPLIKSVEILSEYKSNNSNFYRNIGLRIKYQSNLETLNNIEINNINSKINQLMKNILNNNNVI
uniref:phenylalanine--tRNA ligase n=1 Tax=Sarcopeltis skottsbergii TaxID=2765380 RepID=A0A7M3VH44_SARSK|nr:phenylalanine tRNA synthetase [Sarcopeltis skottsbergii]